MQLLVHIPSLHFNFITSERPQTFQSIIKVSANIQLLNHTKQDILAETGRKSHFVVSFAPKTRQEGQNVQAFNTIELKSLE